MKIAEYCAKLDLVLQGKATAAERLQTSAQALQQAFKLQSDEVAILVVDRDADVLRFVWPARLQQSGFIPLSSRDALAVKTVRENRPFVNNRFASTYHASVFEQVKLDPKAESRPLPIQKILSVPLPDGDAPRGVIQLSRKAATVAEAGSDFSQEDVNALSEIAKVLVAHF